MVQLVVGGREAAGDAGGPAAEWIAVLQADFRPGGPVEVRHHLEHGALNHRADTELDRLKAAFASGDVVDVAVEEIEKADPDLTADDLLLIGDDVGHLQGAGVDQTQVQPDVHHIELAGDLGLEAGDGGVAALNVEARRTDVEVQLGDAADEIEIRSGHL